MTWTRLSDGFADSPRVMALSDAAFRAHVTALIWSNRQLTDGSIPATAIRLFVASSDPSAVVRELVRSGLWSEGEEFYQLDWAEQEPAAAVTERRDANAARNRKHRERARLHKLGDHSLCDRCSAVRDASRDASRAPSRDASRAASVTPYPTRPDPTHREGREGTVHEVHSGGQFLDDGAALASPQGAPLPPPESRESPAHVPGPRQERPPTPPTDWGTVPPPAEHDRGLSASASASQQKSFPVAQGPYRLPVPHTATSARENTP